MSAASDVPEGEVIAKCQRLPRALSVVIYLYICRIGISACFVIAEGQKIKRGDIYACNGSYR